MNPTKVCIFNNVIQSNPQETTLEEIVRVMQTSKRLEDLCRQRKKYIKMGNKMKADHIKKKMLPAFSPIAYYFGGKRREDVIWLTDICFLDYDHVEEEKLTQAIQALRKDEHTLLACRSVSGDGLHLLIRYKFQNREHPGIENMTCNRMNFTYGSVFKTISRHYAKIMDFPIDKQGSNMERLCIISYDSDLYYNPSAIPIVLMYEQRKRTKYPKVFNEVTASDISN
jgi:hypothetical protein